MSLLHERSGDCISPAERVMARASRKGAGQRSGAAPRKIVPVQQPEAQALIAACRNLVDFADPLVERELLAFARRARTASRGEAATVVREAVLILGRWGRVAAPACWAEREERAARLLGDGICGRAAVTLLPQGVSYEVETLSPLHDWASISVSDLEINAEATAHSVAAAVVAALFQAIAKAFRQAAETGARQNAGKSEITAS